MNIEQVVNPHTHKFVTDYIDAYQSLKLTYFQKASGNTF